MRNLIEKGIYKGIRYFEGEDYDYISKKYYESVVFLIEDYSIYEKKEFAEYLDDTPELDWDIFEGNDYGIFIGFRLSENLSCQDCVDKCKFLIDNLPERKVI
ncbi:hypothetical protein [Peptostreptococcus faecalis]|uniref:hypothetical protein n=1 Tax=Peptostreptococcus faecalis TaxID=2045015 RepID=UPI000C7A9AE4|nr:hypothetical protein [Peptostreptococcus faecalis]